MNRRIRELADRCADGEVLRGPATGPQHSFDTRAHDGVVEIRARSH